MGDNMERKPCQRRAAIEPVIGHLKTDLRLTRNFLKGIAGDSINLLMATPQPVLGIGQDGRERLFCFFLRSFYH